MRLFLLTSRRPPLAGPAATNNALCRHKAASSPGAKQARARFRGVDNLCRSAATYSVVSILYAIAERAADMVIAEGKSRSDTSTQYESNAVVATLGIQRNLWRVKDMIEGYPHVP